MLAEICADEKLPIGHILSQGHHLSCDNGHSYAMTTKIMAVGNAPDQEGPNDAFLVTPVPVLDANGSIIGWSEGPVVAPLPAPYNCPTCGKPLGIS